MGGKEDGIEGMFVEEMAYGVGPARIDICYQRLGNPDAPLVLLIMGVAGQLVNWPDSFCLELAESGLQVIRFDNRDAGRSTHIDGAPPPDLPAALAGDLSSASYTLSDMAADAVGLLDAVGFQRAHVVGASMGGAIAQMMAIEHPGRVRSLVSMMSTTGAPGVGQPDPEALKAVFGGGPVETREAYIEMALRAARVVGSPAYPADEEETAAIWGRAWDRGHDPLAAARQGIATIATGDRTQRLRGVTAPALVIHGLADRMCDPSGGRATAAAIPGAELVLIEGLGHNLPPGARSRLATLVAEFVWRVEGT